MSYTFFVCVVHDSMLMIGFGNVSATRRGISWTTFCYSLGVAAYVFQILHRKRFSQYVRQRFCVHTHPTRPQSGLRAAAFLAAHGRDGLQLTSRHTRRRSDWQLSTHFRVCALSSLYCVRLKTTPPPSVLHSLRHVWLPSIDIWDVFRMIY